VTVFFFLLPVNSVNSIQRILIGFLYFQLKFLRNNDFLRGYLFKIWLKIVGFLDLSDYFCILKSILEVIQHSESFLHSKMDFEQQKIVIPINLYDPAKKTIS
jgi:hypothetical protein